MEAILIASENAEKIIRVVNRLSDDDLRRMIGPHPVDVNLYFIPNYYSDASLGYSWMTCAQSYLDEYYTYDEEKIKTEFVEITPK